MERILKEKTKEGGKKEDSVLLKEQEDSLTNINKQPETRCYYCDDAAAAAG